jgi:hypothetical protein
MLKRILDANKGACMIAALITAYGILEYLWGVHPWYIALLTAKIGYLLLVLSLQKSVEKEGIGYDVYYAASFFLLSLFELAGGEIQGFRLTLALCVILIVSRIVTWRYSKPPSEAVAPRADQSAT